MTKQLSLLNGALPGSAQASMTRSDYFCTRYVVSTDLHLLSVQHDPRVAALAFVLISRVTASFLRIN